MHKATPELVAKAKKLRGEGYSYGVIGTRLGLSSTAVRCWLDDEFRLRSIAKTTAYRQRRALPEAAE